MFFENIVTERLLLKNISLDDRDFILKEFSDDAVNRYLFDAEPLRDLSEADEVIAFYLQPDSHAQHRWIITDRQSGERMGTCGFHCLNEEEGSVEIGYDMQQQYWGKGIMTEALTAMLAEYVGKLKVTEVHAHISVGNERSIGLAQRLGFTFSGKTVTYTLGGKEYLHHVYVLRCEG